VFGNQALTHVLLRSRFGLIWLGRGCLLLVLTGYWLLWRKRRGFLPAPWLWFLLLLGLALMLTTSLNAHAAGNLLAWLLLPADVIHLACTGFWLGGLAGLVLTLPPVWRALLPGTGERTRLLAALIPRFSRLALFSVGLLAATGTLMAVVQLGSWQALTGSPYGLTLLLKLGLFLVLLLLGAANLLRISPRMRRFARKPGETAGAAASFQAGTLQRRFRRIIVSECAVALLLLGSVGALTSLSPPPPAQRTTTPHWQGTVADLTYQLAITPGISGPNAFEVLLTQQNGSPLVKTDEVLLRFQMLDMAMGIQEVSLQPVARQPGHYAATNSVLSMAGHWRITLIIRRAGFDESQVSFSQNVV
jgi:copper transport protein